MTYTEMYKQALEMPIDDLTKKIAFYTTAVNVLSDVKKIRIKDGEQTSEMIRRAQKKAKKSAAQKLDPNKPREQTIQQVLHTQTEDTKSVQRTY